MEKNCALSVNHCRLQALQFSVHLIDLLSILLWYNGFTRIQKVVVGQMGSWPPNNDHDLYFGASLYLGSALELLGRTTELVIISCIKSTCQSTSQSDQEMFFCFAQNKRRWHLKMIFFFFFFFWHVLWPAILVESCDHDCLQTETCAHSGT